MAIKTIQLSEKTPEEQTTITTDLLIPGRGEPIKNAAVVIRGGKISRVCSIDSLPPNQVNKDNDKTKDKTKTKTTHVAVLMPGLWDCHLHYAGLPDTRLDNIVTTPLPLAGARAAADANKTLLSGFTSCRDLMGYGVEIQKAIDEGVICGPTIYSAVCALSQTAGHGDAHSMSTGLVRDFCNHGGCMYIADGVDECRKAVRMQIRRGAKVIKVMATGGVLSGIDDPEEPQFSPEELEVIVKEAAKTGRVVAAHCHGKAGILAALEAGCKTIEHGSYLDDECIALMKQKGAMLVATSTISKEGVKHPELMEPGSYKKMVDIAKAHDKSYSLAVAAGVTCALGTDLGASKPEFTGAVHGNGGQELYWACKAGMTPLEAIECATANGPLTLGDKFAPLSGQLKEGYDADLIALDSNPLDDISVFAHPERITHVWKGGKLFKSPSSQK